MRLRLGSLIVEIAFICSTAAMAHAEEFFVYSGTYTGFKGVSHSRPQGAGESHSKGIYVSRFNSDTGVLTEPQLAAEIVNPSFITVSPDHRFLYAAIEDPTSVGPPLDHASYVSAFAIDPRSGRLKLLNTLPSGGTSTCFLSLDRTGRFLLLAHFGSSNISVLHLREDGSLGETTAYMLHLGKSINAPVQDAPHPHSILASPDNRHVIVSDLGLDKIFVYDFDVSTGALSPPAPAFVPVTAGGGPRHFAFDPAGTHGYQISEMSGDLDVFAWDPAGKLTHLETTKTTTELGKFPGENHSAEIALRPDGRFLYESNRRINPDGSRGPDTIGAFAVDAANGRLTKVQEIKTGGLQPRNFALDPTGKYLLAANEATNNVAIFSIDRASGRLTPTGRSVVFDTPVCLVFVPAGKL